MNIFVKLKNRCSNHLTLAQKNTAILLIKSYNVLLYFFAIKMILYPYFTSISEKHRIQSWGSFTANHKTLRGPLTTFIDIFEIKIALHIQSAAMIKMYYSELLFTAFLLWNWINWLRINVINHFGIISISCTIGYN